MNQKKLGVLGGGQLALMLAEAAKPLGVEIVALDPDANAPCTKAGAQVVVGSPLDPDAIAKFALSVDALTIEIENVSVEGMQRAQQSGVPVYPQPEVVAIIQDKGLQKEFLQKHNLPTSDFALIAEKSDLAKHQNLFPAFLKLRRAGYDGRGVMSLDQLQADDVFDAPCVLEKKVAIDREVSVIVARSASGEIKCFPTVDMVFRPGAHVLDLLACPTELTQMQDQQAQEIAVAVTKALGIVGLLAVEIFIDRSGKILINEMAPRPHNSGHHTIEACSVSQYEQLIRAVFGTQLLEPKLTSPAAMVNLLGEPGFEGEAVWQGLGKVRDLPGVFVHDYGKTQTKPLRKMGHATVLAGTRDEAVERARHIRKMIVIKS